jgi:hypothetical protein
MLSFIRKHQNFEIFLVVFIIFMFFIAFLGWMIMFDVYDFFNKDTREYHQEMAVNQSWQGVYSFINEARNSKLCDGAYHPIFVAGTSTIEFCNNKFEQIKYYKKGNFFYRNINGKDSIVGSFVINSDNEPIFIYYNSAKEVIADAANTINQIRFVKIKLIINVDPYNIFEDKILSHDTGFEYFK